MISDLVLTKELPPEIRNSVAAYVGCIAGATTKTEYLDTIRAAGFQEIKVIGEAAYSIDLLVNDPATVEMLGNLKLSPEKAADLAGSVLSVKVSAIKPAHGQG